MRSTHTRPFNPLGVKESFVHGFKFGLLLAWLLIWMIIAIALAVTIIGIPLAIVAFAIGMYPIKKLMDKRNRSVQRWRGEQPMESEGEVPWEL